MSFTCALTPQDIAWPGPLPRPSYCGACVPSSSRGRHLRPSRLSERRPRLPGHPLASFCSVFVVSRISVRSVYSCAPAIGVSFPAEGAPPGPGPFTTAAPSEPGGSPPRPLLAPCHMGPQRRWVSGSWIFPFLQAQLGTTVPVTVAVISSSWCLGPHVRPSTRPQPCCFHCPERPPQTPVWPTNALVTWRVAVTRSLPRWWGSRS